MNDSLLYFEKCNLLKICEIVLNTADLDVNRDTKVIENLKTSFWSDALLHLDGKSMAENGVLESGWQCCWVALRLIQILHKKTTHDAFSEFELNLAAKRKEVLFTCILQNLDWLTLEDCKVLKYVLEVWLASQIGRVKNLPKLSTQISKALFHSLVDRPGKTHMLLELIKSDHPAFKEVSKSIYELYISAVMRCLQDFSGTSEVEIKNHSLNSLYMLLLVMPCEPRCVTDELDRRLSQQCETGVLDLATLLAVTSCRQSLDLHSLLSLRENRQRMRNVNCTVPANIDVINNVFNGITLTNKVSAEELCLRTISLKTHWVEELVALATQFVLMRDHQKVETLICYPELWPALAVNLWKHQSHRPDILDTIIPIIETCQRLYPVFGPVYKTLLRLQQLTSWLGDGLPDVNVMLSLTRSHSTLYILQVTSRFNNINHDRLAELLMQLEGPESWNAKVLEGFQIMFSVFKVFVKAITIFNDFDPIDDSQEAKCLRYKHEVSTPLLEISRMLNQIEPIDFRLELLEDLFLLLFVRSEDFSESWGEEEDEGDDPSDGRLLRSESVPSPLRRKGSTDSRSASTSSYPSSLKRYARQQRRQVKGMSFKTNQGFVCYSLLIEDILNCIQECIQYWGTECDSIDCDRMNRFKKSVYDARWRLDLLSTGVDHMHPDRTDICFQDRWECVHHDDDSSDSDTTATAPSSPVRQALWTGGAESTARSESGTNLTRGKQRSSSTNSVRSKNSTKLFSTSSCLINLMLASPASIVSYLIAKCELKRATKTVQKFNLNNAVVDIELNFLIEFSNLKNKIAMVEIGNVKRELLKGDTTLQAITESTSSNVLTIALTKLIETFFAVTILPCEIDNNKAVVLLDLAFSPINSLRMSACLLDIGRTYFSSVSYMPGALKAFASSMTSTLQSGEGWAFLGDIFLDPSVPLRAPADVHQLAELWPTLDKRVQSFQVAFGKGDDVLADTEYLHLTSCAVSLQGIVQNYQDETKTHFLNRLRSYLTCLWKVVSNIVPSGTKYHIMHERVEQLVGQLVFLQGCDPVAIETALSPLFLNVVHLVVASCTPSLPLTMISSRPPTILLNKCDHEGEKCQPCPPELVETLLRDLLLVSKPQLPTVKSLLEATCRLHSLDWSQLTSPDQLFAFLVNLYNLMWLHALISLEASDRCELMSPSAYLRELCAAAVGYKVGVHFVSLAALRAAICPCLVPPLDISFCSLFTQTHAASDPRAIFVLTGPFVQSPTAQVLSSRGLDRELDIRMMAYVENNVIITDDSITLPVALQLYVDHITLTQGTESEAGQENESGSSREHLYDFLKDILKIDIESTKEIIIVKDLALSNVKSTCWKSMETRPEILKYLAVKNPLVGSIVEKIHCIEAGEASEKPPTITTPLERMLQSYEMNKLATLYDNNVMLATLQSDLDMDPLWIWFESAVQQQDLSACLEFMSLVPEKQIKTYPRFTDFRFWILEHLSSARDGWRYCQLISEPRRLCQTALANMSQWSVEGCVAVFNVLLSMDTSALPEEIMARARQLETSLQTTIQVTKETALSSTEDAWVVVEELMKCDKVSLALQWYLHGDLINTKHSSETLLVTGQLILALLERGMEVSAQDLLCRLPLEDSVRLAEGLTIQAKSVSSLQQLVMFLRSKPTSAMQALRYEYLDIGVYMLNQIPWQEQDWYRMLVSQPELVVEQLLMCTRISCLEGILAQLSGRLASLPPTSPLATPALDALLRRFAAKAVDMRVRTRILPPRHQLTPESLLSSQQFSPPHMPPSKDDWVPNDEVSDCMCCEVTVFSMFNRRHHCRRCGRVVCGSCSPHRFKVGGYGNVKVRVCNDCYEYILPKTLDPDLTSGPRSGQADGRDREPEWWLTKDLVYNTTVREEFTYTHAPSISLCLSILKLHTEHAQLHRFLLTTIESMLQLLRPISPGAINPEVDYSLLITMIRSLLEFAKLSCSQHGSTSDWASVDCLFAEVDLLGLLIASPQTCLLLPTEPLRGQSSLASLRENLLKSEHWMLALEVSTKAGLDYNSVWLAWGKACLKAGDWIDARDKFAHCTFQQKDSQLLADIMQILQNNPQLSDVRTRVCRLKALAERPEALVTCMSSEPRVREECLYYLRTYGSHSTTLAYHLAQNDIKSAVYLLLEAPVETQVFLDSLYLPTLQSARITQLYDAMSDIDKSVLIFKDYLRAACAYCERHQLFHVLYQAQLWMKDYVRAAMTCIHFYGDKARSYVDLNASKTYLDTALSHLHQALNVSKDIRTASPLVMQISGNRINRHIATVKLQLEVGVLLGEASPQTPPLTLFGPAAQRIALATAIVTAGSDLETSFNLAARVADEWALGQSAVLSPAAAQLVRMGRVADVSSLVQLVTPPDVISQILVAALRERPPLPEANSLLALILDVPTKITALIECCQLKSAYLLAAQNDRLEDIRAIMEAAGPDHCDVPAILNMCRKKLNLTTAGLH